ncbi:ribbon-helix-helix domain-containing protein [Salinimicrobium xinjiangense]|uniref:ribbon-helix-helix domain-containing protein n=1 Tax=Salinimicrobium xinjiangense TaxID=438596 RepID=UPI00040E82BC|nr:CopG family transcriptional regulator [Salinimicrobium xinjiangense]
MGTFTSSLPQDLLDKLSSEAKKRGVAKNSLIEKALRIYLDQLNRADYARSYSKAGKDEEIMAIAEEGMETYLQDLKNLEE